MYSLSLFFQYALFTTYAVSQITAFGLFEHETKLHGLCKICPAYCHQHVESRSDDRSYEDIIDDYPPYPHYGHDYEKYPPYHHEEHPKFRPIHHSIEKPPQALNKKPEKVQHDIKYLYDYGDFEIVHNWQYVFKPTTKMPMPTTSTTTMAPKTTTMSGICEICSKKCDYPPSHTPSPPKWWDY